MARHIGPAPCSVSMPIVTSNSPETWNPWSYDIFDELAKLDPNTAKDEGEAWSSTERCKDGNIFVSELDEVLDRHFGRDYLITFTKQCFANFVKDIRQKAYIVLLQERDSSDETELQPPSCAEIIEIASQLYLTNVPKYCGEDIPLLPLANGIKIELKVAHFTDMDTIFCYPIDEPFLTYRKRLCSMLEMYCEDPELQKPKWGPCTGQLCFVKVTSWAEVDAMMVKDKGEGWKRQLNLRTNEDDDGWMAGKWFRGICISNFGCNLYPRELSIAFEFFLVDVGRNVPIHKNFIRFAVLKFATIPALSIRGCLVLNCDEDDTLPPKELNEKWYSLLPRGTVFPCTVLDTIETSTIVAMPIEIERKYDDDFNIRYPQLYEERLAAKHDNHRKREEIHFITVDDLNFDL